MRSNNDNARRGLGIATLTSVLWAGVGAVSVIWFLASLRLGTAKLGHLPGMLPTALVLIASVNFLLMRYRGINGYVGPIALLLLVGCFAGFLGCLLYAVVEHNAGRGYVLSILNDVVPVTSTLKMVAVCVYQQIKVFGRPLVAT